MNHLRSMLAGVAIGLAGFAVTLPAQDLGAVRQRMEQRLASVDALKTKELVGENNRGYLESRGNLSPAEGQLVAAENADRGVVYAAIARSQGATSEQVGRARAKKLAEMSQPGVWVQTEAGEWKKK